MTFIFKKLDHIQIAAPKHSENLARSFYGGILGFQELEKPEALKRNGGAWFISGQIQLHIGIEDPFVPARKAHPAFEVENLHALQLHLTKNAIDYIEDDLLPGARRIYVFDPFGNRIEILEWL